MKTETNNFTVEYEGAEFVFKFGTQKDIVGVLKALKEGGIPFANAFLQSRLVEISGWEHNGHPGTVAEFLELDADILEAIRGHWQDATIAKMNGEEVTKKKKQTKK